SLDERRDEQRASADRREGFSIRGGREFLGIADDEPAVLEQHVANVLGDRKTSGDAFDARRARHRSVREAPAVGFDVAVDAAVGREPLAELLHRELRDLVGRLEAARGIGEHDDEARALLAPPELLELRGACACRARQRRGDRGCERLRVVGRGVRVELVGGRVREERRVGKEWRSRWSSDPASQKKLPGTTSDTNLASRETVASQYE